MKKTKTGNLRKGLIAMAVCYLIWGFQPLYFVIDEEINILFLLACRIVWASVSCIVILAIQGKLGELWAVFKDRKVLAREIPASALLLADWGIYLFAVIYGKVMEASMGYYILPIVMFAFGALIFHEKMYWYHILALAVIAVGIVLSAGGFGGFPYVTILLAVCFAIYSALKKSLTIDSIVSTTAEILMMLPVALIYIATFGWTSDAMLGLTFGRQMFLIGSGLVTGIPMVFFAIGVEHIPLSMAGIMQYLSPSLCIICGLFMGESLDGQKLLSFCFIWVGVIIYTVFEIITARKAKQTQ